MTYKTKFTEDQFRRCAELGMTKREAAREIGCAEFRVHDAIKKWGLEFQRKKAPSKVDAYKACADLGMTVAETAKLVGVTVQSVNAAKLNHGIKFSAPPIKGNLSCTKVPPRVPKHQRRDYMALRNLGKYRAEEAMAILNRPRVKVRAPTWADAP